MNKNKHIMFLAPFQDQQSGVYVLQSFVDLKHNVAPFESREALKKGTEYFNQAILENFNKITPTPDIVLILKGNGIYPETIKKLKEKTKVVIWIFDVTLGGKYVKDSEEYIKLIKEADYFFTIAKGSVPDLKKLGVNAHWLKEGCHLASHYDLPVNKYEQEKFGAEAVFIGSIGTKGYHEDRLEWLSAINDASVELKIYGNIANKELVSESLLSRHLKIDVINEDHNLVCNASKIVLGHCGWPDVEESYSARLYRVLAAGGFYLTNYIKGMENTFKINKKDEEITDDQHFAVYYDTPDCVRKIFKLLKKDDLRKKISENGQKFVTENHTFKHRIEEMLKIIESGVE